MSAAAAPQVLVVGPHGVTGGAMLTNALDALHAADAPLQRVVLIGGGKS
jgi:hypothetical protein